MVNSSEAAIDPAPQTQPDAPPEKLSGSFYLIWFGQLISSMGSALTSFGFGVWLFQRTGSVLDFSLMILCGTLPPLLVTPWVGSVADRLDKRRILMSSDAFAAIGIGALCLLLWRDSLQVWHLYLAQAMLSLGLVFQAPAGQAAVTRMVPKSLFGRAGGMFAASQAMAALGGPLLGAALISWVGLHGILVIDFVTFIVSLLCLGLAVFPLIAPPNDAGADASRAWLRLPLQDFKRAIGFFKQHPTMELIYMYMALGGFLAGIVTVMVTPLVLSTQSPHVLALITTSGGAGALVGAVTMAVWGGPKRFTPLILGLNVVEGLAVASAGYLTAPWALCLCAFMVMFSSALLSAAVLAVWRRKVPMDQQGSVAALQRSIELSLLPLSAVVGGVLATYWFEPALLPHGILFDTVGAWFGVGKGRGTGLLLSVVGIAVAAISLLAIRSRRLQRLEDDVPDAF